MYIAIMNFGSYRKGDEVPENLPNNDERLTRGLIREVKIVKPEIKEAKLIKPEFKKGAKDFIRKPKNETK